MSSLAQDQIAQLLEALKRQRQDVSAIVGDELAHADERSFRGIAGGVTDSGDAAAADAMADLDAAQMDRQVNQLRDIDAALQRLHEGTYGECVDCGTGIGFARLKASPAATRCIDCQGKREHQYAHPGTPRL